MKTRWIIERDLKGDGIKAPLEFKTRKAMEAKGLELQKANEGFVFYRIKDHELTEVK